MKTMTQENFKALEVKEKFEREMDFCSKRMRDFAQRNMWDKAENEQKRLNVLQDKWHSAMLESLS